MGGSIGKQESSRRKMSTGGDSGGISKKDLKSRRTPQTRKGKENGGQNKENQTARER